MTTTTTQIISRLATMTKNEKSRVRAYVEDLYSERNGRNVHIRANEEVHVTIDGNGSQMSNGKDMSGGRILAGYAQKILRMATNA